MSFVDDHNAIKQAMDKLKAEKPVETAPVATDPSTGEPANPMPWLAPDVWRQYILNAGSSKPPDLHSTYQCKFRTLAELEEGWHLTAKWKWLPVEPHITWREEPNG